MIKKPYLIYALISLLLALYIDWTVTYVPAADTPLNHFKMIALLAVIMLTFIILSVKLLNVFRLKGPRR